MNQINQNPPSQIVSFTYTPINRQKENTIPPQTTSNQPAAAGTNKTMNSGANHTGIKSIEEQTANRQATEVKSEPSLPARPKSFAYSKNSPKKDGIGNARSNNLPPQQRMNRPQHVPGQANPIHPGSRYKPPINQIHPNVSNVQIKKEPPVKNVNQVYHARPNPLPSNHPQHPAPILQKNVKIEPNQPPINYQPRGPTVQQPPVPASASTSVKVAAPPPNNNQPAETVKPVIESDAEMEAFDDELNKFMEAHEKDQLKKLNATAIGQKAAPSAPPPASPSQNTTDFDFGSDPELDAHLANWDESVASELESAQHLLSSDTQFSISSPNTLSDPLPPPSIASTSLPAPISLHVPAPSIPSPQITRGSVQPLPAPVPATALPAPAPVPQNKQPARPLQPANQPSAPMNRAQVQQVQRKTGIQSPPIVSTGSHIHTYPPNPASIHSMPPGTTVQGHSPHLHAQSHPNMHLHPSPMNQAIYIQGQPSPHLLAHPHPHSHPLPPPSPSALSSGLPLPGAMHYHPHPAFDPKLLEHLRNENEKYQKQIESLQAKLKLQEKDRESAELKHKDLLSLAVKYEGLFLLPFFLPFLLSSSSSLFR